ncbi:H/ACA RNA-protein complex protein Gar1 [Halobacteriales archaeon QH_10_67_13]|nr:MAG: H/ACA RNA-protein complex protein Gar1 [Halobacteriales archaeon QH_10_67_13]
MKRIGEVVRSAQGVAVVRCRDRSRPEIGTALVDEQLTAVGKVVDVFGPTTRPYLALSAEGEPAALLGAAVYSRPGLNDSK